MDHHVKFSLMPKLNPLSPDEDSLQLYCPNFSKARTSHREEAAPNSLKCELHLLETGKSRDPLF
jgi:hypothetical protein